MQVVGILLVPLLALESTLGVNARSPRAPFSSSRRSRVEYAGAHPLVTASAATAPDHKVKRRNTKRRLTKWTTRSRYLKEDGLEWKPTASIPSGALSTKSWTVLNKKLAATAAASSHRRQLPHHQNNSKIRDRIAMPRTRRNMGAAALQQKKRVSAVSTKQ